MKKLLVLMAAALLVLASSCDTKNIGSGLGPNRGPLPTVVVPTGMEGGADATWSVSWIGGTAPFSVSWNWGGGANPNTALVNGATSPNSQTVTMVNPSITDPATYTYTVRVTDAQGLFRDVTGSYTVAETPNQPPVINSVNYNAGTRVLTVNVSDPDGDDITVTVTEPAGLTAGSTTDTVAGGGPGDATFSFSATDIFGGGNGTTTITADDGAGGTDTDTANITAAGIDLEPDTLIAVPLSGTAAVSDGNRATDDAGVVVVVATGVPANPFQFLNGVGVTIESDATFVSNTFNAGAVGGDAGAVDGYWTAMAPGQFLLPPDGFIVATDIGGGLERWDFNLTPVGGSDQTTAEGELFNCKFEFGAAGTYTFGFQEFELVNRTYYQDGSNTVHFWGDITNAGVPNSVTAN